jgi:hypothetical protein
MRRTARTLSAVALAAVAGVLAASCSGTGGSGGSSTTPPSTTAPTTPTTPSANPCTSAIAALALASNRAVTAEDAAKSRSQKFDRHSRWNVFNLLWTHEASRTRTPPRTLSGQAAAEDVGDVAVVQDEGDIILPANLLDLAGKGLTFARNSSGGYDVRAADSTFDRDLGTRLSLGDDATVNVPTGTTAQFFGQSYTSAFVNSDGNITFGEGDTASTERDVSRFLTGAPRIALAFADLDPSAGGAVFASARSDAFVVTWCAVPGFEDATTVTAQVSIARDGAVTMRLAATTTRQDIIVGVSPGRTNEFKPVDLSTSSAATVAGGSAAVGERFAPSADVDFLALAKKFYQTHGDSFDQLVIWTDQRLVTDAFAFESTVANEIAGIGVETYDASGAFGSGGRLRSVVMMDALSKYPADPAAKVPNVGENSTLSLIGQEAGHRWLAFLGIKNASGGFSNVLLGRDDAHWSFFTDSDASVMEGNDIQDLGGGNFRTVGTVSRYSALDQYAMGLRTEAEVPPFFYVDSPTNFSTPVQRDSAPRTGVTFTGTRRVVLIQDIVAAMGARSPSADQSPRVHNQAFIHLVSAGRAADGGNIAKIDRIRQAWEAFFLAATDGRMHADTRINR